MNKINEEIEVVNKITQNQDIHSLKKKKLHHRSHHDSEQRCHSFIGIFKWTKCLKQFLLWIFLFTCLFLIAGPLVHQISSAVPAVQSRNIAPYLFSEERARNYLNNLTSFGPRVSSTSGNYRACKFLIAQIKLICSKSKRINWCEFDLQNFNYSHYNQLENIIVRVSNPMTRLQNISSVLLSAHYDSVEFSVGGSDNGSGVVILLELLANLLHDLTLTFSNVHLIIVFTNAEESGLYGAKKFITDHSWSSTIRRFINVDATNCNEKANLVQMKPLQLIHDYSQVIRPRANVIIENMQQWIRFSSDYNTYSENGSIPGYDFGFILDGYTYHTPLDDPSMIKQGVLQDLGENLGILIRDILLGHVDIRKINTTIDNNSFIYFDILGRYLVVYKMSTSLIIQIVLIILVLVISIILILFDHIWHRRRTAVCIDSRCIYSHFKYPLIVRLISIISYFISNLFSILNGIALSIFVAFIISKSRPITWYGSSILAIFLFSVPCLIGMIAVGYVWNIFRRFILKKWYKNLYTSDMTIECQQDKVSFDFEQNLAVLFVYGLLMIISIHSENRSFYLILIWSICIYPIYLLLMIVEFYYHWRQSSWKLFEQRYHWLYIPLIVSLLPLSHTIEIINRVICILIPFMARRAFFGQSFNVNFLICKLIAFSSTFCTLLFLPTLQRTKQFRRTLIVLLSILVIIFIIVYTRQPITSIHPNIFYAKHISKSVYRIKTLSIVSYIVPLESQSSSITLLTYTGLTIPLVLDDFSSKSGYRIYNRKCIRPIVCTFDDTFNRTIAIQQVKVESIENLRMYRIVLHHVLSNTIEVSTNSPIKFLIQNQWELPRVETIIDVTLKSSSFPLNINIIIRRCDLHDSPFLVIFTRLMPNMVLKGKGQCEAINDETTLIFTENMMSNEQK